MEESLKLKLLATIETFSRLAANSGVSGRTKACKGFIQLKKLTSGDHAILVSTLKSFEAQNLLVRNIEIIHKKFLSEGKATIQMKEPQINLMIRDSVSKDLSQFLTYIEDLKNGKVITPAIDSTAAPKRKSDIDTTESKNEESLHKRIRSELKKSADVKKREEKEIRKALMSNMTELKVKTRADYPVKEGFSSKLVKLTLTSIGLKQIDSRVLALNFLQHLFLDSNYLTTFSINALSRLKSKLLTLSLSHNFIENISEDFFLTESLVGITQLLIKNNKLKKLPRSIVKLSQLKILDVSENSLDTIPYNIFMLRSLSSLNLNNNNLTFLPITITLSNLSSIEISHNNQLCFYSPYNYNYLTPKISPLFDEQSDVPTLTQLAASTIMTHFTKDSFKKSSKCATPFLKNVIKQEDLPSHIYDLLESTRLCFKCKKMSLSYRLKRVACPFSIFTCSVTKNQYADKLTLISAYCHTCAFNVERSETYL